MRIVEPVTSRDEEYWMWQAVAHGAREIANYAWYPMSSGFESNGYGLINLDGTLTDRARTAGATARTIERNAVEINRAQPVAAQVAIFYDRLSYMVGGSQPSPGTLGNAERDSLLGLYRAFFEDQIPVDFVHPTSLSVDHLAQYKLLFLPYPVMLSESVANAVKEYVRRGGMAVAEARLAWNNDRGYASPVIPGFGLDQVFGAREKLIRPEAEPKLIIQPSATLPSVKTGQSIPVAIFAEHLEPIEGGRVLASFPEGEPAVVENRYGSGTAVLVGSFAALSYQRTHDSGTKQFLVSFADAAGVRPEVRVSGSGTAELEVRRLTSGDGQFVFAFNHSSDSADAVISMRLPWQVRSARDVIDDRDVPLEVNADQTVLRKKLAPNAIWVVRLERR